MDGNSKRKPFDSLRGNKLIEDDVLEKYQDLLFEFFKTEAQTKKISKIPLWLQHKVQSDHASYCSVANTWVTGRQSWAAVTFNSDSYLGIIGNGAHWVLYNAIPEQKQIDIYDTLVNYVIESTDFQSGLQMLTAELSEMFNVDVWNKNYLPPEILQRDGHNCGAGVLLQIEMILNAKRPNGVDTLQKYRKVIASDIKQGFITRQISPPSKEPQVSTQKSIKRINENLSFKAESKKPKCTFVNNYVVCGYCKKDIRKYYIKEHTEKTHKTLVILAMSKDDNKEVVQVPDSVANSVKPSAHMSKAKSKGNLSDEDSALRLSNKRQKLMPGLTATEEQGVPKSYFDYKIEELVDFIESKQPGYKKSTAKKDALVNERTPTYMKVAQAKSINDIISLCPYIEQVVIERDNKNIIKELRCTVCQKGQRGKFSYNIEESNFDRLGTSQPPEFLKLKQGVSRHVLRKHKDSIAELVSVEAARTAAPITKSDLDDAIKKIMELVNSLPLEKEIAPESAPKKVQNEHQNELMKCNTVESILAKCKTIRLAKRSESDGSDAAVVGLKCTTCLSSTRKRSATFHYDVTQTNANKFFHLKFNIKKHFGSSLHASNNLSLNVPPKKLDQKNYDAGLIVGRAAYKSIVKSQSYNTFEDDIAYLANAEAYIGDINHSSKFVSKLRPHFYKILKNEVKNVIATSVTATKQRSGYTIWADKITVNGSTLQIIGIVTMVKGNNTALLLGIKPVTGHTGSEIANDIVETLLEFFPDKETAKKYLCGQSYDGQYIHLKVAYHVAQALGSVVDMSGNPITPMEDQPPIAWLSYHWDLSHIIELGYSDASEVAEHSWVTQVQQAIVEINKTCKYGKGWNALKECADTLKKAPIKPGSFSDTRFAAYKFRQYKKFYGNYESLMLKLEQDTTNTGDLIDKINNAKFCLRLCGILDIASLLSTMSRGVQSSTAFPWETDSVMENSIENLKSVIESFSADSFVEDNEYLSYFNAAVKEFRETSSFKGIGVLDNQIHTQNTRSLTDDIHSLDDKIEFVRHQLASYANSLKHYIQERYEDNHSQKPLKLARQLFSREDLCGRPPGFVPAAFTEYCDIAQNYGFLEERDRGVLNREYMAFTHIVIEKYDFSLRTYGLLLTEKGVYADLLNSESELLLCPNVANLLVGSLVRNKSEAIAESTGSLIKRHADQRGNLTDEHLDQELFMHFNSSECNTSCDGLVKKSLDSLFDGRENWHFVRKSDPKKLKPTIHGLTTDKMNNKVGRVQVVDDDLLSNTA